MGIAALVAILLGIATELAPEEALPEIVRSHLWWAWPAILVLAAISICVAFLLEKGSAEAQAAATVEQQKRNRLRMIQKVRSFWIKGVLEKSLHNEVRFALGLEEHPDAVSHKPWNLILQQPDREPRSLPPSTEISTVFDEFNKALLILGAPGAGKTTTLLELARDLLDWAERDETEATPVVFNLSSWAGKRKPLADWLVDELNERYDVPHKLAQAWVDDEQILLLLDGLDEVAPEHREASVDAINAFREQHGLVPLAVCSRTEEYDALTKRLRLPGAVVVQPLTRKQIEAYLKQGGPPLEGVRAALQDDPVLWELLETPLMLNIVALAYQGRSMSEVLALGKGELEERRTRLFATYTDAMFGRRGQTAIYTRQQTLHWLPWLARSVIRHRQSVFYLEWMQPNWLPTRPQALFVEYGAAVAPGLLVPLTLGLFPGLIFGPGFGLFVALSLGAGLGLLVGLTFGMGKDEIRPIETIRWSWSRAAFGLLAGLGVGLLVSMAFGLVGEPLRGVFGGLLFCMLGGVFFGLRSGGELATKTVPNEGFWRSMRSALLSAMVLGLAVAMVFGLLFGLGAGLLFGLLFGLLGGLNRGGYDCLRHLVLRILLWRNGVAPWNYTRFLDYAAERIFLRKVGGGYIFVHRLLLEYFAALEPKVAD